MWVTMETCADTAWSLVSILTRNTTGLVPVCTQLGLGNCEKLCWCLRSPSVMNESNISLCYSTGDQPTLWPLTIRSLLLLVSSLEFCLVNQALSSLLRLTSNKKKWMTLSLSDRHSSSFRKNIKYLCLPKNFYSRVSICISAWRESGWSCCTRLG